MKEKLVQCMLCSRYFSRESEDISLVFENYLCRDCYEKIIHIRNTLLYGNMDLSSLYDMNMFKE